MSLSMLILLKRNLKSSMEILYESLKSCQKWFKNCISLDYIPSYNVWEKSIVKILLKEFIFQ